MDPLTALSLASNVISFVSFASGLIKGTIEISASANGCTSDVTNLENICERLQSLCDDLNSCADYEIPKGDREDRVVKVLIAVQGLCEVCKDDGEDLLRITNKLKTKNESRGKWVSFGVALKKAWAKTSIDELEARLSRTQATLTLHICTLTQYVLDLDFHFHTPIANNCYRYYSHAQSKQLEHLQRQSLLLQSDQAKALSRISEGLVDLQRRVRTMKAADFQHRPRDSMMGDIDSLKEKLQSLSLSEKHVEKQQAILESLTFETRPVRHTHISPAHEMTFKWALKTNQDQTRCPSVGDWLKQGEGIFWISGKPGSGKSTLMKYIADSEIASRLITKWARPSRSIIASHYFWIAGTSMQKSKQGLLQTLLYAIFRQCPHLIDQACEKRLTSAKPGGSWSLEELHGVLQTVATGCSDGLKFCFIIDGMDEYSGDHEDRTNLCRTFKDLAKSGNVKLILSSRPWNIFEEEFGLRCPKIYMQDLTRHDIETFVTARLEEHTRWATIAANHSQGQWLVSEIAAKSNGVFLWVFLVTKLLREGLTNRDTFADLRRRLQSFPSELESFFKTILEGVEPFYHSHMSTALQLAATLTESRMNFLVYSFHFQEYDDPGYAINKATRFMDADEIQEMKNNTSWHLDSRTRGLLEVHPEDGTVTFLHRTARDFLNTQEMHDFLLAKTDSRLNFLPELSILRAHIALIKSCCVPQRITRTSFGNFIATTGSFQSPFILSDLLAQALKHTGELELSASNDLRYYSLLDELDRCLLCLLSDDTCKLVPDYWSHMKQAFLREQLVQLGLFKYLHYKLNAEPNFLNDIGSLPILRFLTIDPTSGTISQHGQGTDVLVCLLKARGMDPNKIDENHGISPWNALLVHICHWGSLQRRSATSTLSFLLEEGILRLLLQAGADPNSKIVSPGSTFDNHRRRAASVVYLEFCFDVIDLSPQTQALYLDVLTEVLRLSNTSTLKSICKEFCAVLSNRSKDRLHWNLPFFSRVNNEIFLSLTGHGPETAEARQSLDEVAKQAFPLNLYVPLDATITASRKGKRKKKAGSIDGRRKNQRKE